MYNKKRCYSCGELKVTSEFCKNSSKKDSLSDECRNCRSIYSKKYRLSNPFYDRNRHLKNQYGISKDEFDKRKSEQSNVCLICGDRKKLVIDHDHSCCPGKFTCGKCIRGLLCESCNKGIGFLKEDINILLSAISYLFSKKRK